MPLIQNILFPVDFSPACVGMAAFVKRAAMLCGAKVSLVHVVDLVSHNGFELYLRSTPEIAEEHRSVGRYRLNSFLTAEFPLAQCDRILASGEAATEISRIAREGKFDLVIMPTYSGLFRQMLLGSTTAKVLNDADCPVLTSQHAQTITPRPLEHRDWLCAIGLSSDSERVLRFASQAAAEVHSRLSIIHAIQFGDSGLPIQLNLAEQLYTSEMRQAKQRITDLLKTVGLEAPIHIVAGSNKEALLEAARQSDADVLMIGRSPRPGARGRMRDLTYAMVRDSPFPVLSI